jgi:hypothetical protein
MQIAKIELVSFFPSSDGLIYQVVGLGLIANPTTGELCWPLLDKVLLRAFRGLVDVRGSLGDHSGTGQGRPIPAEPVSLLAVAARAG